MPVWLERVGLTRDTLIISSRTAFATIVSLLLARLLRLPEFYWAPISTIVILLSTIDPLTLAWQRFAGTAVGAFFGALVAAYSRHHWTTFDWLVYGTAVFLCGILSSILRLGSAYRFAAITLTIVLLIPHERAPWVVGMHRFIEVSLGIAVALLVTLVWRRPTAAAK